ncbi:hypothetical protein [Halorussus amylolyticus]|nr:hypothetical protein [Halorussus amylolyticus]
MTQNTKQQEFAVFLNSRPDDLVEVPTSGTSEGVEMSEEIEMSGGDAE